MAGLLEVDLSDYYDHAWSGLQFFPRDLRLTIAGRIMKTLGALEREHYRSKALDACVDFPCRVCSLVAFIAGFAAMGWTLSCAGPQHDAALSSFFPFLAPCFCGLALAVLVAHVGLITNHWYERTGLLVRHVKNHQLASRTERPPILLLRSFREIGRTLTSTIHGTIIAHNFVYDQLSPVERQLRIHGIPVLVGGNETHLDVDHGALIVWPNDDQWMSVVVNVAKASLAVVVFLDGTNGVQQEIEMLLSRGLLPKTIFVVTGSGDKQDQRAKSKWWAGVLERFAATGLSLPSFEPSGQAFVIQNDVCRCVPLTRLLMPRGESTAWTPMAELYPALKRFRKRPRINGRASPSCPGGGSYLGRTGNSVLACILVLFSAAPFGGWFVGHPESVSKAVGITGLSVTGALIAIALVTNTIHEIIKRLKAAHL